MKLFAALVLILPLAVGCGPPDAKPEDVVGKWTGKLKLGPRDLEGLNAEAVVQANRLAERLVMNLEVFEDGKYKITSQTDVSDGVWEIKGDTIVLSDNNAGGAQAKLENKQPLKITSDGKRLVGLDTSGRSDATVTYTRDEG
jgi:hypothetical protein